MKITDIRIEVIRRELRDTGLDSDVGRSEAGRKEQRWAGVPPPPLTKGFRRAANKRKGSAVKSQNRVQWVYSSRNNRELAERYDQWAKGYDRDLDQDFGYNGPQRAAEVFARYAPLDARVLDAGAGTGLVGQALHDLGYQDLVGIDLSMGMLEQARDKGVYAELHQMVMGERLGFSSGSFGAVISVGVLTLGHAPPNSLGELIRVSEPGGHIVFTLRPDVYQNNGFRERQEALVSEDKWRLAEVSDPFQALPKGEPGVYHQVWVYRVSGE